MASWLVTGGAGYIGAHVVKSLRDRGEDVVVLDDLSTGLADRVPADVALVQGSITDADVVRRLLQDHPVAGIIHIAAKKQVGESVEKPLLYYDQNVTGTAVLLNAAVDAGVGSFVFSSSAATYGMPDVDVVTENEPTRPMSPYGETKLIGEWLSRDVAAATDMRVVALRYFNVAGAASPELGDPAILNLIPMVFRELTNGSPPRLFGNDYPTPDGTCIRDFIHVADIADAHVAALQHLDAAADGVNFKVYNVSRGVGASNLDVLKVIGEVTGYDVTPDVLPRRPGDPPRIVGSVQRLKADYGWTAKYDLRDMVESAWQAWQYRRASV